MGVEFEINSSASARYIGWAPAPCRVRQTGASAAFDGRLASAGSQGGVLFYGTGATPGAASATQAVTLPADGSWVSFWAGGQFGRPSTSDGDAAIALEDAGGSGIAIVRLMVRIRKDANTLTPGERDRFLAALARLNNRGSGLFQTFRDMHTDAAYDEAHERTGFLPWHRAYLLDLERELQALDASVALPYWRFDRPAPNVFAQQFMGETVGTSAMARFSSSNPLQFWSVDGERGILRRPNFDATGGNPTLRTEAQTLAIGSTHAAFRTMEGNPHGRAHTAWTGWLQDPGTAPKDPVFFLLHCNVDRLWAKWQWRNRLFDSTPPAAFDSAAADRIGHHLPDSMWPWNGVTTAPRPNTAPGGGLASSPNVPAPGAQPIVAGLFDYQGRVDTNARLSFDYDDVPYP